MAGSLPRGSAALGARLSHADRVPGETSGLSSTETEGAPQSDASTCAGPVADKRKRAVDDSTARCKLRG